MCPILPIAIYANIANDDSLHPELRDAAADQLKQNEFMQQQIKTMPLSIQSPSSDHSDFTYSIYSLEGKFYWDSDEGQGSHKVGTSITDPTSTTDLPGKMMQDSKGFTFKSADGTLLEDPAQKLTYEGFKATHDLYKEAFGRNSIDNKGMEIRASIHLARGLDNAFWSPEHSQMIFGDGGRWDGRGWLMEDAAHPNAPIDDRRETGLQNVSKLSNWLDNYDLDTIGHELTHGVVTYTAGLGNAQFGTDWAAYSEAATINEHIADCFGVMVRHFARNQTAEEAGWHFSPGQWSKQCCAANGWDADYARTFTIPDDPKKSPDPYPKHWKDKKDFGRGGHHGRDPHVNAGIASHAFYLAALDMKDVNGGYSWKTVGKIWYVALTDTEFKKAENQTFLGWRNLTVKHAEQEFGVDGKTRLEKAWQGVGL